LAPGTPRTLAGYSVMTSVSMSMNFGCRTMQHLPRSQGYIETPP